MSVHHRHPRKLKPGTLAASVAKRLAHPRHLWRAVTLHHGRKRSRPERQKVRDDAQLKLISRVLPAGFLHYGYFDDPDRRPEDISLSQLEAAQRRYTELIADQLHVSDAPVLDVGCGMGGLLGVLLGRGFAPAQLVALTPDRWQIAHVRSAYPGVPTVHSRFEELSPAEHRARYGAVVTSESLQYLKLDHALPLLEAALRPGGRWVACDYFRVGEAGVGERSGHRWDEFRARVLAAGWRMEVERDVTPHVLPTLRYIHMWGTRFGLPLLEFGLEKLQRKQPGVHYVVSDALRELDAALRENLEIVNPELFSRSKRYMLLVLTRQPGAGLAR